jgi:predicted GNAT family acetyltransferase
MTTFDLVRPRSAAEFLGLAGDFLAAREAEHNLLLGIAGSMVEHPELFTVPAYFAVLRRGESVVLAAIQTAPRDVVLSETLDSEAVDLLVEDLAQPSLGDALPGVVGPVDGASRFAEGWGRRQRVPVRLAMREYVYRLRQVVRPRHGPGRMRFAEPGDRATVVAWVRAFADEIGDDTPWDAELLADRWIERQGRSLYLWTAGGEPVSMAGVGGRTPTGIRVGPVYTPPGLRGHGFASNLVANVAQAQLNGGRSFVFLFADRANSTSNHIYASIGFEVVAEVDRYAFR